MAGGFYPASSTQQLGSTGGSPSWGIGHYGGPSSVGVGSSIHQLPTYGYGNTGYGGKTYSVVNGLPQTFGATNTPNYGQGTASPMSGSAGSAAPSYLPSTASQSPMASYSPPQGLAPSLSQGIGASVPGYGAYAGGAMASGGITPMPAPVMPSPAGPSNWDLQRQAAIDKIKNMHIDKIKNITVDPYVDPGLVQLQASKPTIQPTNGKKYVFY